MEMSECREMLSLIIECVLYNIYIYICIYILNKEKKRKKRKKKKNKKREMKYSLRVIKVSKWMKNRERKK